VSLVSNEPVPGTERYWSELDQYTPETGDLARLVASDSEPIVYVLEADYSEDVAKALLLADLRPERVDMVLSAAASERRAFVAPIRKSHESEDSVELTIPFHDLAPVSGGVEE